MKSQISLFSWVCGILQFTNPGVIHGTHDAELKATLHLLHPQYGWCA